LNAADEQFTGSTDGISAAFDMQQDKIVNQYRDLRDAISEVEGVLEEKRSRLHDLSEEEHELIEKRDGALALAQKAKDESDDESYERHAQAFERFQVRIDEIEATQERLKVEVAETSETMNRYMLRLQDMQSEIEKLPQQKAEAIADFVSANRIVELNDRLQGLESSMDRGPISAVLEANKKLTAKARISEKLAGTDIRVQDREYLKEGRQSTARSRMEQMLAARSAETKAKTGDKPKTQEKDARPEI
jgi:chromosome segregation ATPase